MENYAIKGRGGNDVQHKDWKGKILRIWIKIIRHGGLGHEVQESWPYLSNATPFLLLIGARKTQVFWHQSEARTAATVWNWSGKTLSPGALLAVLYFSSCHIFSRPFRLFLVPTICPWVSEDVPYSAEGNC